MILENLREFLQKCELDMDEEIVRICGVINVNAFSSIKSYGTRVRIFQCIYPQACLLAHSCIPNAAWSIDDSNQFHICIRTTVNIKKGEMISIAYNIPEMVSGTLHRIIAMEDVAHFVCKCIRCSDPTEACTYVSAIKCFHCEENYLLPRVPTDPDSIWKCCGCDSFQTVPRIVLFLNHIEEAYEKVKKLGLSRQVETKKLNLFIRQYEGLLHKNHYVLQEIRMRIIKLQLNSLQDLNETELERFIDHCKIMLSIADVLMPGFSKNRDTTCNDTNHLFNAVLVFNAIALLQFFLSQGLLLQAAAIRLYNPDGEQEGLKNVYKDIYYLQTRSLLYFNCQRSFNAGLTADANQFALCIQRQLKSFESFIDS